MICGGLSNFHLKKLGPLPSPMHIMSLAPHEFYFYISKHLFSFPTSLQLLISISLEDCIMAAEPEAKFAIHEAAREGKSKYIIRGQPSKLSR